MRVVNNIVLGVAILLLLFFLVFPNPTVRVVLSVLGILYALVVAFIYYGLIKKEKAKRRVAKEKIIELKRGEKEKTEILSLVAHQLKTPLALIRWSSESVLDNPALTEKERERLENAIASTQVMYHTVEDLSHIFKLASKQGGYLRLERVDVIKLINDLLLEYKAVADQRKIDIKFNDSNLVIEIMADKIFLKHAIANLIDNAIQYSNDSSQVEIDVKRERSEVKISVKDSGIGIEPANLERIFERFYRTERAQKKNEHGTGLGLYLVNTIVRKMGGRVDVQSRLDEGSIFTLTFAWAQEANHV